jgi:benzoate-CoA ligase
MEIGGPLAGAFNFARYLMELNSARPGKVAYIDDRGSLSYAELAAGIRRCGSSLRRLGLHSEQRVLLLMQDCNEWPVAFLGALYAGLIPIPVNTLLTADDYAYMLDHSGVSAAIVSSALAPTLRTGLARCSNSGCRMIVAGEPAEDALDFSSLLANGDPAYAGSATHADAMAFWLYSSGSTGRPKGVVHTHANLYWTAELYARKVLQLTEHDQVFSAAKLFFAYGLGNSLSFPLSVGASVLLMAERPTPDAVFSRLARSRPTVFCGAPTLYAGMLASPSLPQRSDVSLRICSSAGEALPRDIGERFAGHFGSHIIDGLGSTEMLHIFLSNQSGDVRYGTTGKVVEGYEVELRDDSGRCVEAGVIGDLWVKGPSAALMYWNDRGKSRETFHGAWLRSGDKYIRDAEGYYTYAGRNDDMLKISGQYVSPFEVEASLMRHQAVLESAVIGVADAAGLCKGKAYVVLRQGVAATPELALELQQFVKQSLAPFKRPHTIEFVAELPKTATGKIQRYKLRELSKSAVAA